MSEERRRMARGLGLTLLAVLTSLGGCSGPGPRSEGETHWLLACTTDADCGPLACLCGVCTTECDAGTACAALGTGAVCLPMADAVASGVCPVAAPVAGVCVGPGSGPASDVGPDGTTDVVDAAASDAGGDAPGGQDTPTDAPPRADTTLPDALPPGDTTAPDADSGPGVPLVTWSAVLPEVGATHLEAVLGFAEDDLWTVGTGGAILHWDGAAWTRHDAGVTAHLQGVWGTSSGALWVVGDGGTVLRRDGSAWAPLDAGTAAHLHAVWGVGDTVFVVGWDGTLLRWDGAAWHHDGEGPERWSAVHGAGADDVWAVGTVPGSDENPQPPGAAAHWSGAAWAHSTAGLSLDAVWVAPSGAVTATGTDVATDTDWPAFFSWTGAGWSSELAPTSDAVIALAGVGDALWAASRSGELLARGADGWAVTGTAAVPARTLWVSPGGVAFLAGRGGSVARGGPAGFDLLSGGRGLLTGVWSAGPDDAWVVGADGRALRWDGATWADVQLPTTALLWEIHGTSPSDVWAVGETSAALRWDGASWTPHPLDRSVDLLDVWAAAPDDVWAVGTLRELEAGPAVICHYDGAAWHTDEVVGPETLWGVGGSGAGSVWAVGDGGAILRWQGAAWKSVASPIVERLEDVWAAADDDAWAIAAGGAILHWDGTAWTLVAQADGNLSTVWGRAPDDVWAVGQRTIVHWDGSAWTPEAHPVTEPYDWLYGVGGNAAAVWIAGNNGVLLARD